MAKPEVNVRRKPHKRIPGTVQDFLFGFNAEQMKTQSLFNWCGNQLCRQKFAPCQTAISCWSVIVAAKNQSELECGPMPNVMVALPNIGVQRRKVWLTPTTTVPCSNAAKTRGAPNSKPTKRSQPLVGRSSPYYEDMWRRYCCLISFFRLSIHALFAKI